MDSYAAADWAEYHDEIKDETFSELFDGEQTSVPPYAPEWVEGAADQTMTEQYESTYVSLRSAFPEYDDGELREMTENIFGTIAKAVTQYAPQIIRGVSRVVGRRGGAQRQAALRTPAPRRPANTPRSSDVQTLLRLLQNPDLVRMLQSILGGAGQEDWDDQETDYAQEEEYREEIG